MHILAFQIIPALDFVIIRSIESIPFLRPQNVGEIVAMARDIEGAMPVALICWHGRLFFSWFFSGLLEMIVDECYQDISDIRVETSTHRVSSWTHGRQHVAVATAWAWFETWALIEGYFFEVCTQSNMFLQLTCAAVETDIRHPTWIHLDPLSL